jgi:hypothetical protein
LADSLERVKSVVIRQQGDRVVVEICCPDAYAAIAIHDALLSELKAGWARITLTGVEVVSGGSGDG